jgi:putative membrane protein
MCFVTIWCKQHLIYNLKVIVMKKLSLIAAACLAFITFQACNDGGSDDAVESANESNEVKQDSAENRGADAATVSEEDSKFAVEAASGGMMEVQLGELAQQKALSQQVKDFGQKMVTDHSKANDELKALAARKNITLPPAPGDDHMDHIKKLSDKSGKEFDKDYIDLMVKDHKNDIDKFEKCSKDAKDADLKAFAEKSLPVLREHHEAAKKIQDALK